MKKIKEGQLAIRGIFNYGASTLSNVLVRIKNCCKLIRRIDSNPATVHTGKQMGPNYQSIVKEKIIYIINPISGTRSKKDLPRLIHELTDKNIFETEVVLTRYKGEATEIVNRKLAENYRYFVAVGGDGTVNEVGKALVNSNAIMGIVPVGSGNGLARHLNIPLNPVQAIETINQKKYQAIDCGLINDKPFFCTCGVGFDALIGEKFALAKGRGFSNYVKTTFKEYIDYKPELYQLTIDGHQMVSHEAFLITFANGSQYGNNAYIAPNADISDGQLEICILSPFKFYEAGGIGIRLFLKNIDRSPKMHIEQGSNVLLERSRDGAIHFDGEPCQMGKTLEISVVNRGLNVIIPN